MTELIQKGWIMEQRITCCGPVKERWTKGQFSITLYPGSGKYILRHQGRHILTQFLNHLNERLEDIDKTHFSQKA